MKQLITHYGNINSNTFFIQLINLKQKHPVIERIRQFQKLTLRVKNISKDNLLDLFMGTLKENIQHDICILEPKPVENAFSLERKIESKNMASRRVATNTRGKYLQS